VLHLNELLCGRITRLVLPYLRWVDVHVYAAVGVLVVVYGAASNTLTYGVLCHTQSGCGLRYRKTFECQVLYISSHTVFSYSSSVSSSESGV
jgi:hypothetical protein